MADWCSTCETPLLRLSHGAYAECCGGKGYWSTHAPLPTDRLIAPRRAHGTVTGVLVYLYLRWGEFGVLL